jgi:N-acetylmuramic acid 6-phosphate etherase
MTKSGKVYENLMINLSPSNEKLKLRVIRIVKEILSCSEEHAVKLLDANGWNIRKTIAMAKGD